MDFFLKPLLVKDYDNMLLVRFNIFITSRKQNNELFLTFLQSWNNDTGNVWMRAILLKKQRH
jgi:hypothetical protein